VSKERCYGVVEPSSTHRQTDREVTANGLDMIIKNKRHKTCKLVNVAISADRNVVQKEAETKENTII
jgi:hypothetical protein